MRLVGFGSGTTDVPPDLFLHRSGIPAWKYLIGRPLGLDERISLISDIFSDHDETREVRRLCGDDAQSFVDLVDEVFPCSFPFHSSRPTDSLKSLALASSYWTNWHRSSGGSARSLLANYVVAKLYSRGRCKSRFVTTEQKGHCITGGSPKCGRANTRVAKSRSRS